MVIECSFERLKARFGCLRRDMGINLKDLTHDLTSMHDSSCIIFGEIKKEWISQQEVEATKKYDREFQTSKQSGFDEITSDTGGKKVRQTFVEYFENQ